MRKGRRWRCLWTRLWHLPGELLEPWNMWVKVYHWPAECKLVLMKLCTMMKTNALVRSTAAYQDVLICSRNAITTTVGITTWQRLQSIRHGHSLRSIRLLHRSNRHVEWGCGGNHHSCIFQVLDGDTNSNKSL